MTFLGAATGGIRFMGRGAAAMALLMAMTLAATAQEATLRLHQFLPPQANVPANILVPWADKVEAESDGRIKVDIFSAMALGGRPPELIGQARDGVVDIVFTLPGYTPGLFPRTEVFELPFIATTPEATSRAYWDVFDAEMKDTDFADFHVLATWVHGPGVIHAKGDGIRSLEDMEGAKLRAPTRIVNGLLDALDATPVGMPVPAISESLSKGVIDGAVIPWEVAPSLKVEELVGTHTGFGGDRMFYTATFVLAMNKRSYENLPDDLKAVIDANSGGEISARFGRIMEINDAPGKQAAIDRGNQIVTVEGAELARWQAASGPVIDEWLAEMEARGIDGQALLNEAREAIVRHTPVN